MIYLYLIDLYLFYEFPYSLCNFLGLFCFCIGQQGDKFLSRIAH
ncbi:hypothetical protein BMETH_2253_1 [methanotrophic bacterial endosymbiont of Bathymodiolus sp.]|nr:hypothetical protein BMETH_2253_1 [methanotrophic bacterial endosymbiont of Bathymodiolus sp.]